MNKKKLKRRLKNPKYRQKFFGRLKKERRNQKKRERLDKLKNETRYLEY